MIKKAYCDFCGKEFVSKDLNDETYLNNCMDCEFSHLDLKSDFKNVLSDVIDTLNEKYSEDTKVKNVKVELQYGYVGYDLPEVFYEFNLVFRKGIERVVMRVFYENMKNVPNFSEIKKRIENYYIKHSNKSYSGIVDVEKDYSDGMETIKVGNINAYEILKDLNGEEIEIKVKRR